MATKYIIRIAALAATLLSAAACIYPFEVELGHNGEWPLVIEGDILIGDISTVSLSHVRPFNADPNDFQSFTATGYIEGEDGTRIMGESLYDKIGNDMVTSPSLASSSRILSSSSWSPSFTSEAALTFDTTPIQGNQRYRLHLTTLDLNGKELNTYESDWLEPCPAPTIDGLTYSNHPEYKELWIGLSMHCNGSHYFRWTFDEDWEYHSDVYTNLEYKVKEKKVDYYDVGTYNLYYCWKSAKSSQIDIFSTANQTEDRFEELAFHRIPLGDKRLQVLYRIQVHLDAISEKAYDYWNNIKQGSEGQGSIFSPTPSQMASNVHCISDADVQVVGYLNLSTRASATMYYDNGLNHFYIPGNLAERDDQKVSNSQKDSLAYWYAHGYLPFDLIYDAPAPEPSHTMWTPKYCIDCRLQGGTKTRPKDWPNGDH